MKKLMGMLFALVVAAAMLPGLAIEARAAENELSGMYTETTIPEGAYTLADDVALSGSVSIAGEVTIDLNGKTLSGSIAPYFTVESTGKLTIIDSGTGGTIDGSDVTEENATTSLLVVKGTLIQKGGDITGYTMCSTETNRRGAAVYVDDKGVFEMHDGAKITSNKLGSGYSGRGVVGVRKTAVFTMYGGEISGNTSQYGGAISNSGNGFAVNIHGGKITDNTATGGGSAIYLGVGSLTITGGEISGNRTTSTSTTYAMTLFTDATDFTMTGGTIGAEANDSTAVKSVRLKNGNVSISGEAQILQPMTITSCTTKLGGLTGDAKILSEIELNRGSDQTAKETVEDGIYTYTAQPLTYEQGWQQLTEELVSSGTLSSGVYYLTEDVTLPGSVTVSGDVTLYLDGHVLTGTTAPFFTVGTAADTLTINDRAGGFGEIRGITAAHEMLLVNGKLVLDEGTLTGHKNTATGSRDAGAVKLAANARFVMNGGAITGNTVGGRGGAVMVQAGSSFIMNDGELSGNSAAYGGAVYSIGTASNSSCITLNSGVIKGNTATGGGSACYLQFADMKMAATALSEGTVIEGSGTGNTVHCIASKVTMSGGSIDADKDTGFGSAALYVGKTGSSNGNIPSEVVFTGTAVVGGAGFNCNSTSTGTIHDLRRLGKVTSKVLLTEAAEDPTVGYTQNDTVYNYHYDRPVDLRILSIGNSYSMDFLNALAHMGDAFGLNIEAAYLYEGSCTLRRHAYGLANSGFEPYSGDSKNVGKGALYEYYHTDPATGDIAHQGIYVNVPYALAQADWDVVTLHQGTTTVAFPGTFNSDVDFLTDYLKEEEPNADLYWYMTWSYDPDIDPSASRGPTFAEHFDRDSRSMYNAIVEQVNRNFVPGGAFAEDFAGWLPVGAAVQNMRELGYDHSMNRDGFHLSYMGGRFVAALTALKTLFPEIDLDQLRPEDLTFVATRWETRIPDKFNVIDDLDIAVRSVKAAVAEAQTGRHEMLTITTQPAKVETVTGGASTTVAQTAVPAKPQFPTAETLGDGTVVVAAYENAAAAPKSDPSVKTYSYYCYEGAGRIVLWDNSGDQWNYDQPLFVLDQAQLEAWGISHTAGRYAKLKADVNADYTIFSDPRDPKLTAVTVDADNDGQVDDEMLLLTFWVRDYNESGPVEHGTYMAYSPDGGKSWQLALDGSGCTDTACYITGDAAVFADGSILVPYRTADGVGGLCLSWNPQTQVWDEVAYRTVTVPDTTDVDGSYTVDSVAFATAGDTLYAFVGGSGVMLTSADRGESWNTTPVGNQSGLICQPGLTAISDDRLFVTWAGTQAPYDTYGKLYVISEGWDDTTALLLYDATGTDKGKNEAGNPTAVKLSDGNVLVVSYDANYRSVVGTPVELPKDVGAFKDGDTVTAPTKAEHVFGGWYADAECTVPYTAETGYAYTKFVPKEILSVKAQITAGTTAQSTSTAMRILTTVDNLYYREVGFYVTIGEQTQKIPSRTVFTRIVANSDGVAFPHAPTIFHDQSGYFMTFTITNIQKENFDTDFIITPYWITLDGTECKGVSNTLRVSMGYTQP
ncbi:MAG: DUF4886 domain-containing protein [Oscillospiraceae bacterium]|nr:DUF4886 domain-containing protein [Oscillospiraceae bacterium]